MPPIARNPGKQFTHISLERSHPTPGILHGYVRLHRPPRVLSENNKKRSLFHTESDKKFLQLLD